MEGTYDFSSLGFDAEITDPEVSVDPRSINIESVSEKKITCNVELEVNGAIISPRIPGILVNDLNYDYDQLIERVEVRCQDFLLGG